MKKIKLFALYLLVAGAMFGCSKYDDTELKNDVNDLNLKSRVEKLESWCNTTNGQISALQGIVSALEEKDFVIGVTPITEGSKEVGYTITFTKSKPITIMHGKDGAKGEAGITPIVGTKQDTDGQYYWTIKIGSDAATWMLDDKGKKIRTTGDKGDKGDPGQPGTPGADGADGHSPVVGVAEFEGRLYWQIDGEWLLKDGLKVPATGDNGATGAQGSQGDAIFAEDGVDYTSDPENVTFTLADGTTKITLPKSSTISVGFESYDPFGCSETNSQVTIVLPATLKESDCNAITATIYNQNGTDTDIQTRSTSGRWRVQIVKPSFVAGSLVARSAKVLITMPEDRFDYKAILKVTLIDSKGREYSASRVVWRQETDAIDNTTGRLSDKISDPAAMQHMSVIGMLNNEDFAYIRENLTSLERLDLSRTALTELPEKALAFYNQPNTSLKTIILPEMLTTIGNSAFAMCTNLQEVNIPNSVTTLGRWMFEGASSLEEVKLPEGITTLPASAFYGTGIKTMTIPSSVTTIGDYAFQNCTQLKSVNIPSGVTVLAEGIFYECSNLESVVWHDNITSVAADAFMACKKLFANKEIVLPAKVTSVGARAFSYTEAASVKLPEGLLSIASSAFNFCRIQTVDLPSTITSLHAVAFMWSNVTTVICRSTTPPAIPTLDDNNNVWPPFHQITPSCVLKKPASSDYAAWTGYFGGGIQDL